MPYIPCLALMYIYAFFLGGEGLVSWQRFTGIVVLKGATCRTKACHSVSLPTLLPCAAGWLHDRLAQRPSQLKPGSHAINCGGVCLSVLTAGD